VTLEPAHVRLARARHQGREAFHAGDDRAVCPYGAGTAERDVWEASYDLARELRERLGELWRRHG
jgi:ribosome modulation factor